MPGASDISRGNLALDTALLVTITPAASVTTGASVTSTYSVIGIQPLDLIGFNPQGVITAPLSIGAVWVSAVNTLSVQWTNASAATSSASPAAVLCLLNVTRASNPSQIPSALE